MNINIAALLAPNLQSAFGAAAPAATNTAGFGGAISGLTQNANGQNLQLDINAMLGENFPELASILQNPRMLAELQNLNLSDLQNSLNMENFSTDVFAQLFNGLTQLQQNNQPLSDSAQNLLSQLGIDNPQEFVAGKSQQQIFDYLQFKFNQAVPENLQVRQSYGQFMQGLQTGQIKTGGVDLSIFDDVDLKKISAQDSKELSKLFENFLNSSKNKVENLIAQKQAAPSDAQQLSADASKEAMKLPEEKQNTQNNQAAVNTKKSAASADSDVVKITSASAQATAPAKAETITNAQNSNALNAQNISGVINVNEPAPLQNLKPAYNAQGNFQNLQNAAQTATEQVTTQFKSAIKNGEHQFEVKLEPRELGKVELKLQVSKTGQASLTVTADSKDTLEVLQRDARVLERALNDSGLKADSSNLNFNLRDNNDHASQGNFTRNDDAQQSAEFDFQEFLEGTAIYQDGSEDGLKNYSMPAGSGVNIFV